MKHAVSISIGSGNRNKVVEVGLLGEMVRIERIGTDGSREKAAQLYRELDGKVDAFGVGGTDIGLTVGTKYYPLYSIGTNMMQAALVVAADKDRKLTHEELSHILDQIGFQPQLRALN